jgi:hypothetical protein
MWDIQCIVYGFFMSQPSPFGWSSEITPLVAGENPFVIGPFSLTGILAGAGEGWEDICQGALGQALLELFQKAGNGMQAARNTANSVMQSSAASITNMVNRSNLMRNRMALQMA